jgi:kynureninase
MPRSTASYTLEAAAAADAAAAAGFRGGLFALPRAADGSALIYLCGHSLGLAPRSASEFLQQELQDWQNLGVLGHEQAARPWIDYADHARAGLAALTGAQPADVVAMNSLSVNLHLMLASFYRPAKKRTRVLIEAGAFSSDRHAIAAQIAWQGLNPASELVELAPRAGEDLLRDEDIDTAIATEGDRLALVLWPGLQFRTGQAFDCRRIAAAAHAAGALVGFDHAHAIGNLLLDLPASGADFAVWCSYKYLNAGPGAIGGAYVATQHAAAAAPRLAGWWGHEASTRFRMEPRFEPAAGAAGWAVSNPPIFSAAPLLASLEIFMASGIASLRVRSLQLTEWLQNAIAQRCGAELQQITPHNAAQRGAMLSLRVTGGPERSRRVFAQLGALGVIADFREPDVLRLAPAPLYNSFTDVQQAAERLADALRSSP